MSELDKVSNILLAKTFLVFIPCFAAVAFVIHDYADRFLPLEILQFSLHKPVLFVVCFAALQHFILGKELRRARVLMRKDPEE